MSDNYLGNAKTPQIFAPNNREDLIPVGTDGPSPAAVAAAEDPGPIGPGTTGFILEQEVPGGYEESLRVHKRKFIICDLVTDSPNITFNDTTNTITISDDNVATLFSTAKVGQTLLISGAIDPQNNGRQRILSISFDDVLKDITITVDGTLVNETGGSVTIKLGYDNEWVVLEPVTDYVIDHDGNGRYNALTLVEPVYEEDFLYVIHRSEATFEFRPSEGSVGPDELTDNLRNFVVDAYDASAQDTFALTQDAINANTLEVYVDGVWQEGRNQGFPNPSSTWELNAAGDTVTFDSPITGRLVIKHLSFSTVSRRANLSQGQFGAPPPGSVGSLELENGAVTTPKLANLSVTNSKIANNAITTDKILNDTILGEDILLDNDEYLRWRKNDTSFFGAIKLDTNNSLILNSANETIFTFNTVSELLLNNTTLRPTTDGGLNLGELSNRYDNIYLLNNAEVGNNVNVGGNVDVTGNIIVDGSIVMQSSQTVDGVDISDLESRVASLEANSVKPGMIQMWGKDASPPSGWLLCQGGVVSQTTYADLFAAIGTSFNTGGEGAGNFRLPNFTQRFPLGKASSGTGSGWGAVSGVGGSIDHTHTVNSHSHTYSHTHGVPGHKHGKGNLSINSSGIHTTSISHDHGSFSSSGANANVSLNDPAHTHDRFQTPGTHHTGTGKTFRDSANISGAGGPNTTNSDGNHNHPIQVNETGMEFTDDTQNETAGGDNHFHGLSGNRRLILPQTGIVYAAGAVYDTHQDAINAGVGFTDNRYVLQSISGNYYVASSHSNHSHTFSQTAHDHVVASSTTGISLSQTAHGHSIDVPNFSGDSSSNGAHNHTNGDFTGEVGLIGGTSGDSTFSTISQSSNTTSSETPGTSINNPPFQTIHFIIKT